MGVFAVRPEAFSVIGHNQDGGIRIELLLAQRGQELADGSIGRGYGGVVGRVRRVGIVDMNPNEKRSLRVAGQPGDGAGDDLVSAARQSPRGRASPAMAGRKPAS